MSEEKFQEGQEAYSVEIDYNDKIKWTVYQVLKVLPKSLKLQEKDWRPQLMRQKRDGTFCCYSGAVIKPSREAALRSAIAKARSRYKRHTDEMDKCVIHLALLGREINEVLNS
ncbi:hypothetical protein KAR91_72725 [Candidatus Pacearchaeota archaeon]|nr:hypothetical protein [Candidatus Pacearchaeota archaeon]